MAPSDQFYHAISEGHGLRAESNISAGSLLRGGIPNPRAGDIAPPQPGEPNRNQAGKPNDDALVAHVPLLLRHFEDALAKLRRTTNEAEVGALLFGIVDI